MRVVRFGLMRTLLLASCLGFASTGHAVPYEQRSTAVRALFTGVAAVANITPIVSAIFAPQCLPGYIVCKLMFVGFSVVAATDLLWLSGPVDSAQPVAVLQRGFGGDWVLTGRHIAGDAKAQPFPEAPPPPSEGGSGWEPPPL